MTNALKEMDASTYYADPFETPSLSQSMACDLVLRSPAHARLRHPKLGMQVREDTASQRIGQAIHSLLLGGSEVVCVEADDFKTKAAQHMRDLAIAHGKIPFARGPYDAIRSAADGLRERLAAKGYSVDAAMGNREITALWEEVTSQGEVVQCRGRLDFLRGDRRLIIDIKTTSDARPDRIPRHMMEFGYDIQAAAYTRAIERIYPDLAGKVDFLFLFMEVEPPFPITPVECAGSMRQLGQLRWEMAIDLWAECLRTDHWPDYVEAPIRVEAPTWEMTRWMGRVA